MLIYKNIVSGISTLNEDVTMIEDVTVNLGAFLKSVSPGLYFSYEGSLTTPGIFNILYIFPEKHNI